MPVPLYISSFLPSTTLARPTALVISPRRPHRTKCSMSNSSQAPAVSAPFPASSWDKLAVRASSEDFVNGPNLISPSRERESLRLFSQKDADVRLVLYRDHANWCPYCHKVQLLLEAKKVPYMVKKINMSCYGAKPEEFLKIVPTGLLPVIKLDGKIITESMDIMFLLEDTFQTPYRQMIPVDDNDMMQAFHRYMRLERVFTGSWLGALRGPLASLGRGLEPVNHTLDIIEGCLGEFDGPYFYPGELPSFVDINFSTVLERARSSLRFWRNLELSDGRPNLRRWFEAWDAWEPATYLQSDDWTHIGALPPQIGPVQFGRTRSPASLGVETARTKHVLNDGPERALHRRQAASAICRNHAAVTKDALRGVKDAGENFHGIIDFAFRVLSEVLVDPDKLEEAETRVRETVRTEDWVKLAHAIRFERARCCAPRDMPIRAMEQFCGVINWMLRTLEQEL